MRSESGEGAREKGKYFIYEHFRDKNTHRVFWHAAGNRRPSATGAAIRRRGRATLHPGWRRRSVDSGWCSPGTCRCCTWRSGSASCYSRCAACSRSCRRSVRRATAQEIVQDSSLFARIISRATTRRLLCSSSEHTHSDSHISLCTVVIHRFFSDFSKREISLSLSIYLFCCISRNF